MTREEALEKAVEFLKREKIAVGKHLSTNFDNGEELRKFSERLGEIREAGYYRDKWLVAFESTFVPPPEELWGDDTDVIIDVDDKTGECSQFH